MIFSLQAWADAHAQVTRCENATELFRIQGNACKREREKWRWVRVELQRGGETPKHETERGGGRQGGEEKKKPEGMCQQLAGGKERGETEERRRTCRNHWIWDQGINISVVILAQTSSLFSGEKKTNKKKKHIRRQQQVGHQAPTDFLPTVTLTDWCHPHVYASWKTNKYIHVWIS